jgi:AbrB family looped-hinge helix DNA binding protein
MALKARGLSEPEATAPGRPIATEEVYHARNIPTKIFLTYFMAIVRLIVMNPTPKTDTVLFTVKGQVVIPRWLRKDFEINEGTRAVVYKQNDHIVLKPLTAQHYRRLRGSLKGTKAMEVFMSERKREREL